MRTPQSSVQRPGCRPPAPGLRDRLPAGERIEDLLDGAHTRWVDLVSGLPGDPWGFAQSLRPFWWVAGAWVAVQAIDLVWGGGSYNLGLSPVPSLGPFGLVVLLIAIFGSVQLGRGKVWPARPRSGTFGRLLLLGLNIVAIVLLPSHHGFGVHAGEGDPVGDDRHRLLPALLAPGPVLQRRAALEPVSLRRGGQPADRCAARRRRGATVEDRPGIADGVGACIDRELSPWLNGRTPLFSVFPLPEQARDDETGNLLGEPALQTPPFAVLPPVTLEGVTPTTTAPPATADEKAEEPAEKKAEAEEDAGTGSAATDPTPAGERGVARW